MTVGKPGYVPILKVHCATPKNLPKRQKGQTHQKIYPPVVLNQEYAPLEVNNDNLVTVGKSRYVPVVKVHARTPKNPKNGKKWQKGLKVQKIYPLVVPNQEFAPLEVKNEKTGTVGKSRSLSGQVLLKMRLGSDSRPGLRADTEPQYSIT